MRIEQDEELIEKMYKVKKEEWHLDGCGDKRINAVLSFQIEDPCMIDGGEVLDTKDRLYFSVDKVGGKILNFGKKYIFEVRHDKPGRYRMVSLGTYLINKKNFHFDYVNKLFDYCVEKYPEELKLENEKERARKEKLSEELRVKIKQGRDLFSRLE